MVTQTRLNVTLYVQRLSCYKINVKILSTFLIKNKNISTLKCHNFESIHSYVAVLASLCLNCFSSGNNRAQTFHIIL